MKLFKLDKEGYINQKGNIFLIATDKLITGVSLYFAEEEKIFWSNIKVGDKISFRFDVSPKFGACALLEAVNEEDVSSRRILIHGANEDGRCTCANSANCLVPIKDSLDVAVSKLRDNISLTGYTKSWVRTQFEREYRRRIEISETEEIRFEV